MSVTDTGFRLGGHAIRRIVLGRAPRPVLTLLTLGATVERLEITGGDGERRNVALGLPAPEHYLAGTDYLGGTIGRYANRIRDGRFTLDGAEIEVGTHDRGNHLHGGPDGFDRRAWEIVEATDDRARLRLVSPDGDQGFPGVLTAAATFAVTDSGVIIDLTATTDAPTVVNLTNHAYVNLDGAGTGTVDDHELSVRADRYTPVDPTGIPTGGHASVAGSAFDLRDPRRIGDAIRSGEEQVVWARGIDHNYVLDATATSRPAATLTSARTRTRLDIHTDQPGLQVYTGNFLDGSSPSTGGGRYRQGDGIALEPQLFPDTPNRPDFGTAVLRPGETYASRIEWRFSALPA
ncbi:MAG TPA: aldose epimerase family protein [Nocardioides sp.]|nr:aldose epimerase family protein [Nocardioides sp.]